MSSLSPLQIYRRMFGTPQDGVAAYWYFGAMGVAVEGLPSIPVIQAETVMLYRTTTLSPNAFTLHWWEIGYMRDPVTGEVADTWLNPVTGERIQAPKKFEEGPATFTVTEIEGALKIDLVQAHATVIGVEVEIRELGDGRVFLNQIERKWRGFPRPDGSFPEPGEPGSVQARSQLSVCADLRELAESPYPHSSGSYEFELEAPAWMGFGDRKAVSLTQGVMAKAALNAKLNPAAWERLKAAFPERFEGDVLSPPDWF